MTPKTEFKVTEKAGVFVAGQRSPGAGKSIMLTAEQAKYALIAKEIERPKADTPEAPASEPEPPAPKPRSRAKASPETPGEGSE